MVLLQKLGELLEDDLATTLLGVQLAALVDIRQNVENRREQRLDDMALMALLVRTQHRLNQTEQLTDLGHIDIGQLDTGRLAKTQIDRQRSRDIDRHVRNEFMRKSDQICRRIVATLHTAQHIVAMDIDQHIGFQVVGLRSEGHTRCTLHYDHRHKTIELRCYGRGITTVDVGDHQIVRIVERVRYIVANLRNR